MGVTRREQQIIDLYEDGRTVREIARDLGLRQGTVTGIVNNLCRTVGPDDRERRVMTIFSRQLKTAILRERAA